MGIGSLIKQPNGKYCKVDFYGITEFVNYTEEDILNMYIEKAKKEISEAGHYGNIIERIANGNCANAKRKISDDDLKSMGFDKPYDELVKFIPLLVVDESYCSHDFTIYAKCPTCGGSVTDCMGRSDEKCRHCGQLLKWR